MDIDEKAMIILLELDKVMAINWNMEDIYLRAIKAGIERISTKEGEMSID